jgi:hypothetical protein
MRRRQVVKDEITANADKWAEWMPQHALHHFWARVDSLHGRGGKYSLERLSTPNDPDFGDGWRLERFLEALDRDRAEIDAFIAVHPEQADRLRGWLEDIEWLARQRDVDPDCRKWRLGRYYEVLSALGYDGCWDTRDQ